MGGTLFAFTLFNKEFVCVCVLPVLEAQLLGTVVRKERPELEEQKDSLVIDIATNKKKLIFEIRDSRIPRFAVSTIHGYHDSRSARFAVSTIHGYRDSRSARLAVTAIHGQRDSRLLRFAVSAFSGYRDSRSARFAVTARLAVSAIRGQRV